MRNTSKTDYDVIKYNHMSAQTGILNSLVTRVFCPVQTTPTWEKNVWVICITLFHSSVSLDGWCLHWYAKFVQALLCRPAWEFWQWWQLQSSPISLIKVSVIFITMFLDLGSQAIFLIFEI